MYANLATVAINRNDFFIYFAKSSQTRKYAPTISIGSWIKMHWKWNAEMRIDMFKQLCAFASHQSNADKMFLLAGLSVIVQNVFRHLACVYPLKIHSKDVVYICLLKSRVNELRDTSSHTINAVYLRHSKVRQLQECLTEVSAISPLYVTWSPNSGDVLYFISDNIFSLLAMIQIRGRMIWKTREISTPYYRA